MLFCPGTLFFNWPPHREYKFATGNLRVLDRSSSTCPRATFDNASFRKNLYPYKKVETQSCKVVNLPDLQEDTYLIQGSAAEENQTISFYCSDQVGSTTFVRISASEVELIPTDENLTLETTRYYDQTFAHCLDATKEALSLPWNQTRCRPTIVERKLEVPSDWVQ